MNLPFYICKLRNGTIKNRDHLTEIKVTLREQDIINDLKLDRRGQSTIPWIIQITNGKNPSSVYLKQQIDRFKKTGKSILANSKNPIRWLGAGVMPILIDKEGNKYIVLNQRGKFGTRPNCLDIFAGLSSSIKDMLNPRKLAYREVNEELQIIENGNRLIFTKSGELPIKNSVTVIVNFKDQRITTENMILIIDSQTATIDLRVISSLRVDNINNLTFNDSEERFVNKKTKVIQNRPIKIIKLGEKIYGKITPALKACLENLKI